MSWLAYAAVAIVGFASWGVVSKVALDHTGWPQASLLVGLVTVAVSVVALALSDASWSTKGATVGAAAGLAAALGFVFFYLALDAGPASQVVPVVGVYPVLAAVLAVVFLSEGMSPVQVAGAGLAVTGVLLVGLGS
ncbi:MAG: EamA family transporter [Solirubrobacteraceae bacterium]|nr:EamA family transporter [Solirubrobacteraceae bacterium]